jgi:hypothetical protein
MKKYCQSNMAFFRSLLSVRRSIASSRFSGTFFARRQGLVTAWRYPVLALPARRIIS